MFLLILINSRIVKELSHFNTSHVSINLKKSTLPHYSSLISIHLMFLLINRCKFSFNIVFTISIHLMFLLISCSNSKFPPVTGISIHLMFLLIFFIAFLAQRGELISIHLMFLLIWVQSKSCRNTRKFQYISCFY